MEISASTCPGPGPQEVDSAPCSLPSSLESKLMSPKCYFYALSSTFYILLLPFIGFSHKLFRLPLLPLLLQPTQWRLPSRQPHRRSTVAAISAGSAVSCAPTLCRLSLRCHLVLIFAIFLRVGGLAVPGMGCLHRHSRSGAGILSARSAACGSREPGQLGSGWFSFVLGDLFLTCREGPRHLSQPFFSGGLLLRTPLLCVMIYRDVAVRPRAATPFVYATTT